VKEVFSQTVVGCNFTQPSLILQQPKSFIMRHIIFILTISFFIISCGQTDTKQKELDLKERELALKEKELYLDSVENSKKKEIASSKTTTPIWQPTKDVTEKENPKQNTGDRDKFMGKFSWNGECPRGCFYTHIFNQNGTAKTTFETARSEDTYTEKWTVDENEKIIQLGKEKWYYKFINGKIKLTSCQYPLDTHELTREK
jgi:hypothetical protein